DRLELRLRLLGHILPGLRPLWRARMIAHLLAQGDAVELDDRAIRLKAERIAHPIQFLDRRENLVRRIAELRPAMGRKAKRFQPCERLRLGLRRVAIEITETV